MKDCSPEKAFWLKDGRTLKNLRELEQALENMSTETYKHHVTKNQNDFANWTENCLKDAKVTALLRTTKSRTCLRVPFI